MLILLFLPSFPASLHPFVAGQALSVCDSVGHPWSESDAVFPTLQWLHTCGQTAWRQRPHTLVSADACNIDFLKDSFVLIGSWMWVPDIFQSLNRAQPLPVPSLQDHCTRQFFHYIRQTSLSNKLIIVGPDDWKERDKHSVPNFDCETSRKAVASILRSGRIMSRWILVEEVVSARDGWRWLSTMSSYESNQNKNLDRNESEDSWQLSCWICHIDCSGGSPTMPVKTALLAYCRTSENYRHETYHGGERIVIVHDARSNYRLPSYWGAYTCFTLKIKWTVNAINAVDLWTCTDWRNFT